MKKREPKNTEQPAKILIINFDWRNLFLSDPNELRSKLIRDQLRPDFNHFFIISWSHVGYHKKLDNHIESIHLRTWLPFFRPLYDVVTIFLIPFYLIWYDFKPDVVLVYDFPLVLAGVVPRLMYGCNIVLLLTNLPREYSRGRKFGSFKVLYTRLMEKIGSRSLNFVYTINDTVRQYALNLGIATDAIFTFTSDVIARDMHFIQHARRGSVRAKFGIGADEKIMLSVARFEPEKGLNVLLDAFAGLDIPNMRLVLVGEGRLHADLKVQAHRLGISERVIFAGLVPRKEIWNYFADANVFILLSRAEALGLVFWEAMYMHVPVVGSRVGGILETIGKDEERGFLWDETDGIVMLRDKLHLILDDTPVAKEKVKHAFRYVEDKINTSITINTII